MYSGFTNQRQESIYDKLVEKAINIMASRLLTLVQFTNGISSESDQSWMRQLCKVQRYLSLLDKSKQTMPKLS